MMADTAFDRETNDINADFLLAYADVFNPDLIASFETSKPTEKFNVVLNGVKVNPDIKVSTHRANRNNRLKTGFLTMRYAKGKHLGEEVGKWNSSLLFGFRRIFDEDQDQPERALCLTLDAYSGKLIEAPGNAVKRFSEMQSACATIAERWDSIEPPDNAILAS